MGKSTNIAGKEGIPALAYSVNDASLLWLCRLKIVHSNVQFMLSLEHTIPIHGADDEHLFLLRYEGSNLITGKNSLEIPKNLPQKDSLDKITRQGTPQTRMLSLTLKEPCSLWYPRSLGHRKSTPHTRFHVLLTLARATEVRILFDVNWLVKRNLAQLQSIVESLRPLSGFPVYRQFADSYQQLDWSNINLRQDATPGTCFPLDQVAPEVLPSIEDAEQDAPPPYGRVCNKRSRDNRRSLTPDSPLPKRLLQNPTCAPSSAERPTSASSLSSKSTASSTATVQVDIFQDTLTSVVKKELPDMLHAQLQDMLHAQLHSILRDLLPSMLAGPSPSPSISPRSRSNQVANALPQHRPTPSHKPTPAAVFSAVISTHTKTHLQKIMTDTIEQASDQALELHNSASIEFGEFLDDTKLDLAISKDDHFAAFNDDCNEMLVDFNERLMEAKDEAEEDVKARIDRIMLEALDKSMTVENEACSRCKCLHGAKDLQSGLVQGRRAISLPL